MNTESHALRHGPYRIEQVIGRGGMAIVHVARRAGARDTGERFAAKRILPEYSNSPSFLKMFHREAALGSSLHHPNVVRVLDFGEQDGELVLVTEYVDGTSCGRLLRRMSQGKERFPLPVALHISQEVLEALAYTHDVRHVETAARGIVHRDVSPGNILIGAMGEVKLADFGVAHAVGDERETQPGTLKGKLGYMSPEQTKGDDVDGRSDLFSLAVVLFEMISGRPFFRGADDLEILSRMQRGTLTPLYEVAPDVLPFELRLILGTALAKDPAERFQDAREFSQALHAFATHAGAPVGRRALVNWLRHLDIWPVRSGTYAVVDPHAATEPGIDTLDAAAGRVPGRGRY
ncbi:MAG TPA: serine/threonine-protein kinase [Polyangiaceae bacterium]